MKTAFKTMLAETLPLQDLCCIFLETFIRQSRIMLRQNGLRLNLSSKSTRVRDFPELSGGKMKRERKSLLSCFFICPD